MQCISIVISTYKGLNTIQKCVESAMSQDYSNFEVIVVDDNGLGTSNQKKTEAILNKYLDNENFKYIVHEENINGSAARNTGIRSSKGEYIAFLDDDDYLHPDSIR